MIYQVRILYREPTYEKRAGAKPKPYRWTLQVEADSPSDARSLAVKEFHRIKRLSGVAWCREVVGIEFGHVRVLR